MTLEEETKTEIAASIPSPKIKKKKKKKKSKSKSKSSEQESVPVPVPDQEKTAPAISNDHDGGNNSDSDDDDEGLFDIAAKWAETKESEEQSQTTLTPKSDSATHINARKNTSTHQANYNPHITPYNPTGISLTSPNAGYQSRQSDRNRSTTTKSQFSLHITNLPYNATKQEIEQLFTKKGCDITSTRLVFNHHRSQRDEGRNKKNAPKESNDFTGVAFVDVADEKSYKLALELDKSTWNEKGSGGDAKKKEKDTQKGRGWRRMTLNVRPTKTKEELAEIVTKTKEKMMSQKEEYHKVRNERLEREGKEGSSDRVRDNAVEAKDRDVDKKKRKQKDVKDRGGKKRKQDGEDGKIQLQKDNDKKTEAVDVSSSMSRKKTGENKKLTKKERAKKAAILMKKRRS